MSVAMVVVLIFLGLASLTAMIGTVVLVIRDGRGRIPLEPTESAGLRGPFPTARTL